MILCEYGCGREGKHQFKNGRICCENHWIKCPSNTHPMKGRKHSEKVKKKISDLAKLRIGDKNPFFGKHHTEKTKMLISEKNTGKVSLMKGKKASPESVLANSKGHIGKKASLEAKKNMSKSQQGRKHSEETKIKIGLSNKGKRKYNLNDWKKNHPLLFKVEEIIDHSELGKIQVHCKNHNCINSKEKNGWFIPSYIQLYERIRAIENPSGFEENNFYCSSECKKECPLFKKTGIVLSKSKESYYTQEEYNLWRQEVLKRAEYKCEFCGEEAEHCHHSRPQKLEPFFSLDPDFGIACCKKCHYEKGHTSGTECSTSKLASIICN